MLTHKQMTQANNDRTVLSQYFGIVIGILLLVVIVTSACSRIAIGSEQPLVLNDAWGRPSPAMAETAAFYLTITNNSDADDQLVGVAATVCDPAELHNTTMHNGMMHMEHAHHGIAIPANSSTALEPGSFHVMCMGLAQPLATGDEIPLTLTFAEAGEVEVTAVVREG